MNIMYLCDEYPPGRHGGIGTSVQVLARQMAKFGHTVVVAGFYDWGYGGEDEFIDEGVSVFRFRRILDSKWFMKKDSLRVRGTYRLFRMMGIFQMDIERSLKKYKMFLEELIKKYKIDIIEAPDFNEYVQYCNRYTPFPKLSAPTIVKLHGSLSYFLKEEGRSVKNYILESDRQTLLRANSVISVSNYTSKRISEYLNFNSPIIVLYNGIDIPIEVPNFSKQDLLVIFTGSLVAKKGVYQLMKAWNFVHLRIPNAKLWLFGKGQVNKVKEELNDRVLNTVFFKGHIRREDLLKILASAQVAIFPSYAESFGLASIEAMANGTVVINSNRTAGSEIIENGVNGLLIDPDNVKDIAEKIIYLLENKTIASQLAKKGRETVLKKFDIRIIAKQNLLFYKSIIEKGSNTY